ncbi:MAG TPA: A/G-specific adenine glycosylase [Opitutaceae bacterium]|nr:A/G-specific adenine glycosylase [Opitutaceae bacterium]
MTAAAASLLARRAEFQRDLRAWYRARARPLPWRLEASLYRTVVSEFMLQQTQVKTMLPYFARWMEALPDFAALATAPEEAVLKLWEGLGYYSRARNLRRLARELGRLPEPPRTPEAWRELPGVGPYTAAAITSIAFGAAAACVDGNVVRILSRLTADATPHRDGAAAAKALAPLAEALLPAERPGDHNQAMMELGATVCLRQGPRCGECPVAGCCAGRGGDPAAYPRLAPKETRRLAVVRIWCEREGALLLHRGPAAARRLADLHELPTAAQAGLTDAQAASAPLLARRRRSITRFRIEESIHRTAAAAHEGLVWVPLAGLARITLSGPHRRWVEEILATSAAPRSAPSRTSPRRRSSSAPARAPGSGAASRTR